MNHSSAVFAFEETKEDPVGAESVEAQRLLEERIVELRSELEEAESELARLTGSSEVTAASELNAGDIETDALVVVSGPNGSGSGFIAEMQGRVFFVTNIHVLGAARDASFATANGEEIELSQSAFLSKSRDLAIVPIEWVGAVLQLSPSLVFDKVEIGQRVTVMGNSSGANVATRLSGSIRGIGPKEIEVSAEFVPGNSGSPILHDELGTVIGIASYLRDFKSDSKWTEGTEFNDIRRFGYRLDGDIEWEQVALSKLYEQAEAYERFEDRTKVMWNVSYQLRYESSLLTNYRGHESLGYLYEDISSDFNWQRGTASAHNSQMLKRFVKLMLNESQNDIVHTERLLGIEFYKRSFNDVVGYRDAVRNNLTEFSARRL